MYSTWFMIGVQPTPTTLTLAQQQACKCRYVTTAADAIAAIQQESGQVEQLAFMQDTTDAVIQAVVDWIAANPARVPRLVTFPDLVVRKPMIRAWQDQIATAVNGAKRYDNATGATLCVDVQTWQLPYQVGIVETPERTTATQRLVAGTKKVLGLKKKPSKAERERAELLDQVRAIAARPKPDPKRYSFVALAMADMLQHEVQDRFDAAVHASPGIRGRINGSILFAQLPPVLTIGHAVELIRKLHRPGDRPLAIAFQRNIGRLKEMLNSVERLKVNRTWLAERATAEDLARANIADKAAALAKLQAEIEQKLVEAKALSEDKERMAETDWVVGAWITTAN